MRIPRRLRPLDRPTFLPNAPREKNGILPNDPLPREMSVAQYCSKRWVRASLVDDGQDFATTGDRSHCALNVRAKYLVVTASVSPEAHPTH